MNRISIKSYYRLYRDFCFAGFLKSRINHDPAMIIYRIERTMISLLFIPVILELNRNNDNIEYIWG